MDIAAIVDGQAGVQAALRVLRWWRWLRHAPLRRRWLLLLPVRRSGMSGSMIGVEMTVPPSICVLVSGCGCAAAAQRGPEDVQHGLKLVLQYMNNYW